MNEVYHILIYNNYDNHIIDDFIEFCINNNIFLMIFLLHFFHLTQSLDIEIFEILKKYMISKLKSLLYIEISYIQKMK